MKRNFQVDYQRDMARQRSQDAGGPIPYCTEADRRRAAARREIENRRIERESRQ
ncbi:hypothetical protein [Chromobacterium violaceum]|uniref:hypothetical protein n=1 Tax=Chromobacterium violaceum TaxID=536 RepID=UPI001B31DFB4|nr:hypothetical protein [Chromobacterium violaceum]MBP4048995.1 hypothetical protein [Chromobacterium violaceum]